MKITKGALPEGGGEKIRMPLECDEYFKNRHFLRKFLKFQLIAGLCVSLVLVISVFVLTVFTEARVRSLEEEVENLKYALDSVKNLENLIDTIVSFENGDLYPDDDDDADPEAMSEPEVILDTKDYNFKKFERDFESTNETDSPFNLTKDFKDGFGVVVRNKRDVVGATSDGIPINSEPYSDRKRPSSGKTVHLSDSATVEPARDSAYESLPVYSERYTTRQNHQEVPVTSPPSSVHYRSSRVMHVDRPSKNKQTYKIPTLKSGDTGFGSDDQNDSSGEFTIVRRYKQRNSNLEVLDGNHPRVGRIKPLPAVHYSGDTSRYILGQHGNFFGNGHLRHPQQTFIDWKPKEWVQTLGMDSYYSIKNGLVTIGESGLYYIYAQIYYLDEHDLLGYWVQKNGEMVLQCTITLHSPARKTKGNTCFTAGVEYLAEGDTVSIADITEGKYSLFDTGKSFFGLIKIGDARIR